MHRRERRQFAILCRGLAADDPSLARLLTDPADRVLAVATTISRTILWTGLALLAGGILLNAPLLFGAGLVLAGLSWLPRRLARPDAPPGRQP